MSQLGEIIENKAEERAAWIESKKSERESLDTLIEKALLDTVQTPENYSAYLRMQANIPNYSPTNVLLVQAQNPNAAHVTNMDAWNKAGRSVNRGESGIRILMPEKYSYNKTLEDGHSEFREGIGYKVVSVFDISQTHGNALAPKPVLREGTPEIGRAINALLDYSPVNVVLRKDLEAIARYDPLNKTIAVRADATDCDTIQALATEIAYARLHVNNQDYIREDYTICADSIAYTTCLRYGIECQTPDFTDVPDLFSGFESNEIRGALNHIQSESKKMQESIEKSLPRQKTQDKAAYNRPAR